ncbi:hypothetical protein L9F63_014810 [Diploptera punctata]|uniref:Gustatory receptor n=1 Tax=Diploptera punctata TaxID=6984 RepID=A0AAD8A702_DIPPU|nr:hypothetical protein L9F63_014810 [Diploptera punctata]
MDEEQFHRKIKHLYFLSGVFGLLPISPFTRDQKQIPPRRKTLHVIWTATWLLSITCFAIYDSYINSEDWKKMSTKVAMSDIFYLWSLYITCIANYINNLIIKNTFPRIVSIFCDVDKIISISNDTTYKTERLRTTKDIIILIICLMLLQIGLFWDGDVKDFTGLIYSICQDLPLFINSLETLQFKTWVWKLNKRLEMINKVLKKHTKSRQTNFIKSSVPNKVVHFVSNVEESSKKEVSINSEDIQQLKCVYIDLYKAKELINSAFGFPIVCQTMTCYITCVAALYWGIDEVNNEEDQSKAVIYFLISAYTVLLLVWVLLHCHLAFQQSQQLIIDIQTMITKNTFPETVENDLLKFVSLMKDMPIKFTPCGLFTLNLSFLCKTIGVICTYIIIVLQFRD